ncbi:hypothetical protein BC834DRAFT_885008 [Gloeopeniophorella convolvens]|nr:hypothetical protein BC834DRAFT_885008 [Gloeopeniophorella convolvens]
MSLSSFLLGKRESKSKEVIDGDLDAVFRSSATTSSISAPTPPKNAEKKRRRDAVDAATNKVKRKKSAESNEHVSAQTASPSTSSPAKSPKKSKEAKEKKRSKKNPTPRGDTDESDDEENDPGLEDAYERKTRSGKQATVADADKDDGGSSSSGSEADASELVHETVTKDKRSKARSKHASQTPPDETKEQRDARTIFLGNVSVEVAKSKSALKQLKRHILALVPGAKIESTRFRSVAFQSPTSAAAAPRAHNVERSAEWRVAKGDDVPAPQPRLTSDDKKRIAFIKHELHTEADSLIVYVVFAHGAELAPDEAARAAVAALDNTTFLDRTIRADAVGEAVGDPKRTLFVGSLDFASREEDLRVFFEGIVSGERGPRSAVAGAQSDEEDDAAQSAGPRTWVTRVRIVRDKDTQLGKGFAYVQFADRECVDEILALEPGKLKFAKRKLRVERCKTLPGAPKVPTKSGPTSSTTTSSRPAPRPSAKPTPVTIPKGNPELGAKLAHLSKADRKAAKAGDADRVARRLAKKKARHALQVPEQKKDRERVRKSAAERKGFGAAARPQKKARARSEQSVAKRNAKK